jgi:hypothetical protein
MKAIDLINGPVWQAVRKIIPGATKVQIPGLHGVWFNDAENLVSAVVTEIAETGEFLVKASISNVNVPNETHLVSDPMDIPDAIILVLDAYTGIEKEGRLVGRAEYLEQQLGTLTGVNLKELILDEDEENASFDDAVLETNREISLV